MNVLNGVSRVGGRDLEDRVPALVGESTVAREKARASYRPAHAVLA